MFEVIELIQTNYTYEIMVVLDKKNMFENYLKLWTHWIYRYIYSEPLMQLALNQQTWSG